VRFRLSEKATAKFTVQRRKRAHKRGRKWRYVRVRGSFSKRGKAGLNGFRFSGRLRGKKLAHARYRLTLVARDGAGNRSAPKRVRFRIVR
jgi:hypothetical protein